MARSIMLIVNPFSGRGLSDSALGDIVAKLCTAGHSVSVHFVGDDDPETIAYKYTKEHDLVVCAGGDGTLSSVVSGLMRSGALIPVGYIPTGTANDVARTLALSKKPTVAIQTVISGTQRPLDIGLFGDRCFTYVAAFGAFVSVAYKTKTKAKRVLGNFAYILGGIADVFSIKARHTLVEYDGGIIEGDYVFGGVLNSTSIAGLLKIDPEKVDLADGLFEIILVKRPMNPAKLVGILRRILTKKYDGDNVIMLHASKVKFSFDENVAWTVDGEDGGNHKEAIITNCREAIRVLV